jgi:hypothetical protein
MTWNCSNSRAVKWSNGRAVLSFHVPGHATQRSFRKFNHTVTNAISHASIQTVWWLAAAINGAASAVVLLPLLSDRARLSLFNHGTRAGTTGAAMSVSRSCARPPGFRQQRCAPSGLPAIRQAAKPAVAPCHFHSWHRQRAAALGGDDGGEALPIPLPRPKESTQLAPSFWLSREAAVEMQLQVRQAATAARVHAIVRCRLA